MAGFFTNQFFQGESGKLREEIHADINELLGSWANPVMAHAGSRAHLHLIQALKAAIRDVVIGSNSQVVDYTHELRKSLDLIKGKMLATKVDHLRDTRLLYKYFLEPSPESFTFLDLLWDTYLADYYIVPTARWVCGDWFRRIDELINEAKPTDFELTENVFDFLGMEKDEVDEAIFSIGAYRKVLFEAIKRM